MSPKMTKEERDRRVVSLASDGAIPAHGEEFERARQRMAEPLPQELKMRALELREQQLNALVAEHDASSQTAEVARIREGCALAELREALQHRCGQILDFTRGLCELAAADKRGMTEHEARSRLFCLSALSYEELAISPVATEREVFTRRFAFPRSDENVPARNVCVCVDGDIK